MAFDRVAFSGPRWVLPFRSKSGPRAVEAGLLIALDSLTTLALDIVSLSGPRHMPPLWSQSRPEAV